MHLNFAMFSTGYYVFVLLLIFQYVECLSRLDPLVDTNVGLIRGLKADDGDYAMFLGVPYAQVDADNPFGPSSPYPKFEEPFEAYSDSKVCPQVHRLSNVLVGTSDCLHLNIYVPNSASSTNRLPVMVWIYGGAFEAGTFEKYFYGPSFLVEHDVIVVSPNYRIGAYGFMCLDIPEVPGNQGLKDQLLAFQWIKDNIEAFGGDSNKITLFGESAGGHSIDLHLISEKEKPYNQVIIQSGSSLAATVPYAPDKLAAIRIAEHLGFVTSDSNEAISYLAKVDTDLVVSAGIDLNIIFKPCVESQFEGVEPFLSSSWVNAKVPKVKNMPVLIGFTEHELATAYYYSDNDYLQNSNFISDFLTRIFDFDDETFEEMKNLIHHYYFGDEVLSEDLKLDIINFNSDFVYIHPVQRTINKYLEAGAGNIYYYMFSHIGGSNSIVAYNDDNSTKICCASHADDLSYIFNMVHKPSHTSEDKVVVERMTTMWTNFAKYSDPTPEISDLLPVKWEPLTKETFTYMNIGSELSLGSRPVHSRMAFWHLFYKLNEKSQTIL